MAFLLERKKKQGCGSGLDPDPWARKMKKKMHFSLTF
jgi:hypothetical protein